MNAPALRNEEALVRKCAQRLARACSGSVGVEDLEQEGRWALEKARVSFKPERGAFAKHAAVMVSQRMRRALEDAGAVRVPEKAQRHARQRGAAVLGGRQAMLEKYERRSPDPTRPHVPVRAAEATQELDLEASRVRTALDALPDRAQHILRQRFWRGMDLREIGAELGVSPERARQLEQAAIARLRLALGVRGER